jgi:hypothetical protein
VARQLNPLPAPTATAAIALTQPHSASSPNQVGATWTGAAASGGLDVQRATVRISRVGHSGTVYSNSDAPADGTHTFTAVPGSTYKLTVTARDQAAEPSSTQTATVVVPIDDSSFNFSGAWHRVAGSADVAGSLQQTRRHNASASVAGTGKVYSLLAQVGPAYGKLAVFKGRAEVGVINLRSNTIASRRITIYSVGSVARRTFTFVCLGHGPVDVDGLYVAS